MSNKKLFLIMLITLILITMGGVWASEDAVADNLTSSDAAELSLSDSVDTKTDAYQTNVNTTSQTTDDSAEADDSSKNTNGELLGATRDEDILGDKEFSQLSSTIGTSGDYKSLDTNYIGSGSTIAIKRTLTIEGNNFTITNTNNNQRIFSIEKDGITVTFQNINFVGNGYLTTSNNYGGGVIYVDKDINPTAIKFFNCTFVNNWISTSSVSTGGVVLYQEGGGSLEFANCNFTNNYIEQRQSSSSKLTLQGNAILARGSGTFKMEDCNFNDNHLKYTGNGAQQVTGYGTVVIGEKFVATVNRCSFNNSYKLNFANSDSRSQAIYAYSKNILINNTNFTNNKADKGGAVLFRYYDSQVTVENCKFINNTATDCGGAIIFYEPISNVKFKNCDFINNNASNYGAIYIQPKTSSPAVVAVSGWEFTKCNFINNKVTGNNGNGGVILIPHGSSGLTFDYCTFSGNTATEDGGAIYFEYGCSNIYIKNSEFDSNVAKSGGAVIFRITLGSQTGFSNINIINSNFTKNKATLDGSYGGSAIAFNKATGVTIKDSRFEENVAEANGALLFQASGNVYIQNSKFIKNNSTKKSAGAIYFYEATNTLKNMTITECSFDKNTANGDRGPNDFTGCGGAVFLEGSGHKLMYNNFTNNEAKGNGTHGGAVFSKANGVTIFKNTFINNSASFYGGAFTDIEGTGTLTISNSTFTNNSARDGGAIDLYQTDNAVISNCDFDINHALRSAGALYMSCDTVVVDNCNFTNNYAPSAGAIYADVSDSTIKNSRFISNKADEYGGAIYLVRGSNILNCNFADNNASDGGAIYVSGGLTAEISDSTFERNNANISGGAIYYGGSSAFSLKITNDTFIENTALNGGAVDYLADSAIPYRDFNLFEGEATSLENNRYSWNHPANKQIIYSSQFVGNIDYLMNMTAAQIANSYTVLVTITTSKRISRSPEVKITLTYANGTPVDGYTNYIVPSGQLSFEDSDNYTVINIQLTEQEIGDYNITVSIRDDDHQYKQKTANYTVKTLFKGPFEIIQEAIDNATSDWSEGDPIPVVNLTWDVYTYTPQYDEGPIIINSPVIIVGVNNTQINALGYTRLFEINSENVTFINITFKNGNADGNESSADRTHGGAILWNGANGNVINCTFEDNKATQGGAIYWNSTSGTITDSGFNSNNATAGGAVYVNENSADFTVQGTGFMGNDAAGDGGAVYLNSTGSEVINSIFNDNTAHGDGGAVYAEGSENTIIDSEFTLNTADNGGAVYVDGDADIKNSTFTSNQANINGSAIYLNSVSEDTVISNDTFDSNTAHVSGGAIYIRNSDVSVENSTFAQNGAYVHGADICVDDNSEVLLYNLTITNSSSGDASIYVNSDVTVEKTEINSDNAIIFNNGDSKVIDTVINGDNAILIRPDGNVNLTGVNTTGDYAVSNYGTLYLEGNNFTDIILNYGNITSKTTTRILDGETVEIEIGDNLALNASISDDAGNVIIVPGLKFVDNATFTQDSTNDGKIHSGNYNNAQQGVYILTVNNTGLKDNTFENTLLKVKDSDVTVTVQTEPVNQGEIIVIKAIIDVTNENLEIGGNVTFEINGLQYKVSLNETEKVNATTFIATAQITDLIPDTYTVTAYYNGDDTHRPSKSDREFFFVNARDSNITVSVDNVAEGQNATATIKTNATNGTIKITVTGRDPVERVMDGDTYVYDLGALEPGNYTVRVDYVANQFYKASTDSATFEVYEYDMIVEVSETQYNQTAVINITLPADANGPIEVFLNGENLTDRITPLGNGVYQVETDILTVLGEYEVNVTYTNGTDGKYYSRNASETFTVDKNDVYEFELEITPDEITFGDEVNITVTGPAGFEGKLTIDDEEIPFIIGDDGTFKVIRSNFTAGSHTVTANITGDENYTSKEITKIITVESATPLMTIAVPESVEPNAEANVTVTVGENANGTVYISVDGVTTPVEVKDGVATLPLDTTKPGNYTVTAEFISADANYKSASNTTGADYTVERYNSTITSNVTIAPNNNVTVTVTVDGAGDDSNVTLTLSNGVTKTVNVVDGVATFDLGVFDEQTFYNYTAVFSGDKNLNPNSTTGNFTVGGLNNYTVNVTISDTQYGGNTTIKVTIDEPAMGGTVTVYVDETPYTAKLVDGAYVVVTPALAVGNYTVNVTYEAKAPYADKNNTGNILTVKTNSSYTFIVDVIPAPFGEDTVINITGPAGENVTVTIDGVEETVTLDKNGTAIIKRDNLTAGPHTVVANITGNENYTSKEISKTVNVPAATPELSIDITQPIAPNTPANITVFVGKNATGTVVVSIDGNVYGSDEVNEDGYAIIPIRDTSVPGTYNATVKYYAGENDNYNTSSNSTGKTYTIERYDSELSYTAKVSDNNTVTVTVQLNSTATGTVTVKVGEETFNTTIDKGDGGVAVVDLRVFDKSESPVNYEIIYSGDDVFNPKSESASEPIEIGKLNNATVEVEIIEGEFGDNTTIKVTVPKDGDGNVTIYVDGVPTVIVPDENGVAVLNVTETVGPHTVNVTYTNSTKYNDKDWNGSFNVSKDSDYEFGVVVTPENVKFGENVTVTVTAPEGVHEVNVTIDGVTVPVSIGSDGKGNYTLNNLTAGPHTVDVDFAGNENYTAAHNSTSFTIDPAVPKMDIIVSEHIAPTSDANVTVVVGDNATGTVIIYIDSVANPVKVENGTAVLPLKTTVPGTYNVTAEFISGDANYESPVTSDKVNYTIDRYDSVLDYSVDVADNNTVTVTVQLNSTATGTVTVKVGEETFNTTIDKGDGGVAVVDLRVFDKSDSPVNYEIIYSGDDVFNPKSQIASEAINIGKLNNATVEVEIIEGEFGDNTTIKVTVPKDGDGNVTIYVDGVPTVVVPDENGVAVLNVTGTVGPHTVNVTYTNSTKYNDKDWNGSYEVPKDSHYDFNITVEPSEIKYGDNVTITVSAPEGVHEVNLTIDGETVTIPIGSDGKGNHTVTNFTAGPHTVEIDFNGNENYTEAHNSTTFTVDKTQPDTFKVDISEPNNVGDTVNVTVTLPQDATGTVTVKVNGTEYSGKVENGTVTVIIPKLGNGTYPVNVTYSGDSNYDAIYNDTESIVVSKNTPEISAETSEIKYGQTAVVNVTVPKDATGTVTIKVGGVEKTAPITGGVNSISVEGIPVGDNQPVTVIYNGDDKYLNETFVTAISVKPKQTNPDEFKVEDKGNGTIIVTAPEGATGKVNLTIGNETYEANITEDGKAIFDIANKTDQTPGVHDITVTYSGDENNTAVEFNSSANVPKWDSQVNVNVPTIRQGDVAKVNVTVTSPEGRGYTPNGTVRVKVDGKEGYFGTLDENGQAIIDVPGLMEGPHTIDVVYDGNDYYLNATGSANVEVQAPITYKVNGTGNDSEVDVKVPGNGTVEIFIDNEPRDVISDENGNAVANLTGLLPGQHNITIKYTDENDVVSYVNSTVVVPRWTSMVEASAATIRQGDSAYIKVKVDSDETGTVYVDIDGTGYYGVLENGTVTINASGIKKGTYAGNVTYLGDEKYDPSNNTFTLVVESEITIDIEGAGNSSQVVVKLPENGTDNVTVTVDGNNYPVTIVNGTAVADLSGLPAGEHNVTVIYTDKDGTQSVASKIVKVYDSINVADEIKRGWNSPFDAEAEFLDSEGHVLQNATVQFTIDGKTYDVVTDEKGIGKLTTSHLPIGTYEATIKNTVTGETLTRKVTIVKRIIENYDLTTDYLEGKYYSVKVIGDDGNPVGAGEVVGMTVNGVGYVLKTDKDGVAQLKINLVPKKYTIKAEYAKYQVTNKITVKQTMKLVKKTVTVKKGKKITLKATLKWTSGKAIKGKVIKFKFKGKTYKAKTNSKGVAKVVIKKKSVLKKLKKGKKYTYTATYVKNKLKGKVKIK